MIRFEGVEFSYEPRVPVLAIPELEIARGLTLVVGRNGAGKSSLLRLAAGVERPTRGRVTIDGRDLWRDEAAARRPLAYVPEAPELTPYATVFDVLSLVAGLRGVSSSAAADALDRVGLVDSAWKTVRELSMGQKRRAVLAAAFIGEPSVIILDEPLETMDAEMRRTLREWISERRRAGATLVVATHDLAPFGGETDAVVAVAGGRARIEVFAPELGEADRIDRLEVLVGQAGRSSHQP